MKTLRKTTLLLVSLWMLNSSHGQNDTLNLFPFARIVYPTLEFRNDQKTESNSFRNSARLYSKTHPLIKLKIRIREPKALQLRNHILTDKKGEIDSRDQDVETSFVLDSLSQNCMSISITIKPSSCAKDSELISLLSNGLTITTGYVLLQNNLVMEIEPDLDGPDIEGMSKMTELVNKMIRDVIPISPEEADSISHFPYSEEYFRSCVEKIEKELMEEDKNKIIQKMNCLDESAIQYFFHTAIGIKATDSLFALNNRSLIEENYVRYYHQSEINTQKFPIDFFFKTGYTYSEHVRLRQARDNTVYPLDDYLFALAGMQVSNEIYRLEELEQIEFYGRNQTGFFENDDHYTTISSFEGQPIKQADFNLETFRKALTQSFCSDSNFVTSYSYHKIQNDLWMTLLTNKGESISVIFRPLGNKWSSQRIDLPEKDRLKKWEVHHLSDANLTILQNEESSRYYVMSNRNEGNRWLEIQTNQFDTTKYLLHCWSGQSYGDGDVDENKEVNWSLLKKKGLINSLLNEFHREIQQTADFRYEFDRSAYFETKPDHWLSKSTVGLRLESELAPEEIIRTSSLMVSDLDGDSNLEIYHYSLSNGKIVTITMYRETPQGIVNVKNSEAHKLLMRNNNFQNDLIDSLRGNYEGYKFLKKE